MAVEVTGALRKAHPKGVDAVLDLVSGPDAIRRDAEFLKSGGSLVSTIYAADVAWFAERHITAHNVAGNSNPFSTTRGLNELVRMLADGTITARVRSAVGLDAAGEILEKLRNGGLRGKAIIRI
jgi:D-arabinose 1-dehydrogenase-like Zn-dependent alcohol dehydrogenase